MLACWEWSQPYVILLFLTAAGSIPSQKTLPVHILPWTVIISCAAEAAERGPARWGPLAALFINTCLAVGDDDVPDAGIPHARCRCSGERGRRSSSLFLRLHVGFG